jgi:predicted GIY-YIG superfamily endonuclease
MNEPKLYVFELERNHYYVGITNDVTKAFQDHKYGKGSEWTRIYKPLQIYMTCPVYSQNAADSIVKNFMRLYGVEYVRGGSYEALILTDEQYKALELEFFGVQGTCVHCGLTGHFVRECPTLTPHNCMWTCRICGTMFSQENIANIHMHQCALDKKS